jgi:hypothetical protein
MSPLHHDGGVESIPCNPWRATVLVGHYLADHEDDKREREGGVVKQYTVEDCLVKNDTTMAMVASSDPQSYADVA